jgi:predicted dehydrogenase
VLLDHGTHLIYEVLDVAGPPADVQGWTTRIRHEHYDVEDTAHLVLGYPDRMAVLFLTWAARHRETRIRFVGERGTIRWEGGLLHLEAVERTETLDFTAQLDKSSYAGWFSELFRVFARRMESRDGLDTLADIAQVAAVLEAAYRPVVRMSTGLPRARVR